MDKYTEQKIEEVAKSYLKNNYETALVTLGEINKDYLDLFPIIKRVTTTIIEENKRETREEYLELAKEDTSKINELTTKLEKIKEIHNNLEKNKKELSNIINQE